ncbi:cadherin-22-like [Littorina saxatilis]|uniref:cadherin-22-like n=1 Tax=Littorina saxatilis TaxID=31220 RepID=UPI0038B674B7
MAEGHTKCVKGNNSIYCKLQKPGSNHESCSEQNQRPVITNLKGELRVREDAAVDSVVLEMGVVDEGNDVNADTMTYTMTTVPSSASSLFKLDETNDKVLELQVESPQLDYETQPHTINLKITANDGFCDSETYALIVKLVDVNEPPVLEPESQTLMSCEGKKNRYVMKPADVSVVTHVTNSDSAVNFLQVDITPSWLARDQDKDDVIRFTEITPNEKGAFALDPKTGVISTVVDYGIDNYEEFQGQDTVLITVTVKDRQGETTTASVTVRFVDCNDNPPVFPQEPATRIEVRDCETSSGTVVGKVDDAKDGDSAYNQNNVFAYAGVGDGAKVEPSGAIILTRALTGGEVITFPVLATDRGKVPGPLSSKPYYVSISVVQCIPSEPLTTQPYTSQPQPQPQPCQSNTEGLKFAAIALVAILVAAVLMTLICKKQLRPTRATRPTRPTV